MSTGKRLAKRSIIGTRVCAPGVDGKYYSGVIHSVKTPASESGTNITVKTRYSVRFDPVPGGRPPSPSTEYKHCDLIGPGFGSVNSVLLVKGQKVYLTYNGREIRAEVSEHRKELDEVDVTIAPTGQEGTMTLTKRIDEVRLLESRKSARLADQDTDFARLADMAGDRKRASSHSIDVPHVIGSRKRRPSSSNDFERSNGGWGERVISCGRVGCRKNERGDCMDECTAALVLMSLSCSPHSPYNPLPLHCQQNYGSWEGHGGSGHVVAGSPGVGGTSNSSSSSGASWRSGTPSPPLSDEGAPTTGSLWSSSAHPTHNQNYYTFNGSPSNSTPILTPVFDEGIVIDYMEDHPRKKKIRAKINPEPANPVEKKPNNEPTVEVEQKNSMVVFKCTWPQCSEVKTTVELIEEHVRQLHLGRKEAKASSDHEEEFYYQEVALTHVSSPPTMSHRDMARPPHEDPEYQKQLRLTSSPGIAKSTENTLLNIRDRNTASFAITPSPSTPIKHIKISPRAFHAYHHSGLSTAGKMPSSPRRLRGDIKKCRKVYGMEQRELWCTQCRWKKACSRFGD